MHHSLNLLLHTLDTMTIEGVIMIIFVTIAVILFTFVYWSQLSKRRHALQNPKEVSDTQDRNETTYQLNGADVMLLMQTIIKSEADCVKLLAPDGTILKMNEIGLAILQAKSEENVLGRSMFELITPEHRDAFIAFHRRVCTGHRETLEVEVVGFQGRRTWMETHAFPLSTGSEGDYLHLAVSRDISKRKEAETTMKVSDQRFKALWATAPVGIYLTDKNGGFILANQRWYHMTGLSEEEAKGAGWMQALHSDDREQIVKEWFIAMQHGQEFSSKYRFQSPEGKASWFSCRAAPIKASTGAVIEYVGTITDITDLVEANESLQNLIRLKDEFLITLSHELRTPLSPILGWTKLLIDKKLDADEALKALNAIERGATTELQLVSDLLDTSRIMTGTLHLEMQPVDLLKVVKQALEVVQLAAIAKHIDIKISVNGDLGIVTGDAKRLQQVVWNLLMNAIKFTPNDGRVSVHLTYDNSCVKVIVTDTGIGIEPEFMPHVFERFRQADSSTTRAVGGLGIGLSIVRHIVEGHGGEVSAESSGKNLGATFTVSLPTSAVCLHQRPNRDGCKLDHLDDKISVEDKGSSLTGLKTLVVDDIANDRELIVRILHQHAAEARGVASAGEALEMITTWQPHILISDVAMPLEDGYSLIRKVRNLPRENCRKIPAIALTAYTSIREGEKILEAGFQKHLSKPLAFNTLISTVADLGFNGR